jgi:predicted permease
MGQVLGVTAPIYLLVGVGFAAVRFGRVAPADLRVLGRFVAHVCVPALLFRAIASHPIGEVLNTEFLIAYAGGSLAVLAGVTLVARRVLGRPLSLAALQGLGSAGSNSAFVGYPIVQGFVGAPAGVALALCTLVENLLVMPLAFALADAGGDRRRPREMLFTTLSGLVRNPMILGIAAGLAVTASGLQLPLVLDRTVALAAAAAPAAALFVIGGSLVGLQIAGIRGDLALVTVGKLLLHPLAVLALVLLLPPQQPALRAAAVLFAAMPMLSIYPVIAQKHGHERFCAAALLTATLVSFASLSLLIASLPADWRG